MHNFSKAAFLFSLIQTIILTTIGADNFRDNLALNYNQKRIDINDDDCIKNPLDVNCVDYIYPDERIEADLVSLCQDMPQMPGCTILKLRQTRPMSKYLSAMSILADICKVDDMWGMGGCDNYESLCFGKNGTVVRQCDRFLPMPNIPTTLALEPINQEICRSNSSLSACKDCEIFDEPASCDLLGVYAKLCKENPAMKQCQKWSEMCQGEVGEWPELCIVKEQKPLDCISTPSDVRCKEYVYPADRIELDLKSLCIQMKQMPGCSILRIREARSSNDPRSISSPYFDSHSIMADICITDNMRGMPGCRNFTSLCRSAGSIVEDCKNFVPMPNIPTTTQVKDWNKDICGSHAMDGCDTCDLAKPWTCPLLEMYSNLCKQMPDMNACRGWNEMCQDEDVGKWPELCSTPQSFDPPIMRMYFHTGFADYILFHEWVPRNAFQYWLSVLVVFLVAILYESIGAFRSFLENHWNMTDVKKAKLVMDLRIQSGEFQPLLSPTTDIQQFLSLQQGASTTPPFIFKREMTRALFQFVETTISYALMLVAMTFNVALFLAVPAGFAVGTFVFGRYRGGGRRSCCA